MPKPKKAKMFGPINALSDGAMKPPKAVKPKMTKTPKQPKMATATPKLKKIKGY